MTPSFNRRRSFATLVACGALAVSVLACSLIVSTNSTQCQVDSDCTPFAAGATCNPTTQTCVAPGSSTASTGAASSSSSGSPSSSSSTSSSGGSASSSSSSSSSSSGTSCDVDGGIDGGGCYACMPTDNETLLNACTTGCIPFDNDRVTVLLDGGTLPPLPSPGPDVGM